MESDVKRNLRGIFDLTFAALREAGKKYDRRDEATADIRPEV